MDYYRWDLLGTLRRVLLRYLDWRRLCRLVGEHDRAALLLGMPRWHLVLCRQLRFAGQQTHSACECVAPGSVCRDNADCCYSSTCTGGICTAQTCSPDGDYCDTSDSGPGCCGGCNYEGSYCNGNYYSGWCNGTEESYGYCANEGGLSENGVTGTNPTGAYVSCSSGSGCYSGTCNAGECAGVESGYSCRGNFDCVHGSTCVSGTCSAQTCIADGQYCDDYSASCCGTCNDTGGGYDYYCDNYYYGSCTSFWGYYTYNYGTCGCDGGCPDTGVVPANPLKVTNATCSSNSQCYSEHCIAHPAAAARAGVSAPRRVAPARTTTIAAPAARARAVCVKPRRAGRTVSFARVTTTAIAAGRATTRGKTAGRCRLRLLLLWQLLLW